MQKLSIYIVLAALLFPVGSFAMSDEAFQRSLDSLVDHNYRLNDMADRAMSETYRQIEQEMRDQRQWEERSRKDTLRDLQEIYRMGR